MRRSLRGSILVTAALSCLSAVVLLGQQKPTFKSGIDIVVVDVYVVEGSGRPMSGLGPEDFVITVDGARRTIVTADFVSWPVTPAANGPGASAESAASALRVASNETGSAKLGRTIVLVVDEENIRAGYAKWAADAAARFIDRMSPDDRIGLVIPRSRISVAPTTNRAKVKDELSRVVGHMPHFQNPAPAEACDAVFGKLSGADAPRGQQARPSFDGAARAVVADMHDRSMNTLRSLVVLFDSLANESGPKTVVLVSEELPGCDQIAAQADLKHDYARVSEAAARARANLFVMQLDRPVADAEDPQPSALNLSSQSSREASIRGLGLETVTSITGGRRLLVSGIPDAPLARIALEVSAQYLLGVRTETRDRDGKPHPIKVTVNRTGVDVRARQMFTYASEDGRKARSETRPDVNLPPTAEIATSPAATPAAAAPRAEPDALPAAATTPAPPAVLGRSATVGVAELMSRVATYIDDYAERMLVVVGVERYAQWMNREEAARTSVRAAGWQVLQRQSVAEFALVRNASDWDGYRNVYEVDGKPVSEATDRFQRLFVDTPSTAVVQSRKIAAESARYNLGALQRNFNVPTIALYFLTRANQGRFVFAKDRDDEVGGVRVSKVRFEEKQKPTIIKTSAGKDMPVRGEAWIDTDGRVLKTHMQIDSEMTLQADMNAAKGVVAPTVDRDRVSTRKVRTTASITVTYATEARLGLLVPSEMLETYEAPVRNPVSGEDEMVKINCRATYSDFKRFETSGRLVVPK